MTSHVPIWLDVAGPKPVDFRDAVHANCTDEAAPYELQLEASLGKLVGVTRNSSGVGGELWTPYLFLNQRT